MLQDPDVPSEPTTEPAPPLCESTPAPPEREITLEEWIAAGQGCCGRDHESED